MIIYLDYLFIENIIFDFIILKETALISRLEHNNKKILIAAITSSMYVIIMIVFRLTILNYFISKILLAFVMVYIAFKPEDIKKYLKIILMFLLVSIINVGILTVGTSLLGVESLTGIVKIVIYLVVYVVGEIVLFKFWKIYSTNITKESLNYVVTLKIGREKYIYEGFLDTGNTVFSHGMPIIFAEILDKDILQQLKNREYFEVKTVTLSNITIKRAYVFENILVTKGEKSWSVKAGVVFENNKISKFNNYNMILNYILYTESMGGITI